MAYDLKSATPDTTLPTSGFLFGADSQSATDPSVYSVQALATTLLGSTSLTGATITTSSPVIDAAQTWNASGTTFTGLRFNAAGSSDANSASASLLMDLQVGGTSRFKISKAGTLTVGSGSVTAGSQGISFSGSSLVGIYEGSAQLFFTGNGFNFTNQIFVNSFINMTNDTAGIRLGSAYDVILTRRNAANLRLGAADAASPFAQTLSVQSVVAGTSNTAGANLTITGSQGTGTGAGGSIIFQVAPVGSSGTAQNALATALTINSTGKATFAPTVNSTSSFEITNLAGSIIAAVDSTNRRINLGGGAGGSALSVSVSTGATTIYNAGYLGWTDATTSDSGTVDTRLYRDDANKLALRNGTNAQAFRVYNTFTSATDFERANIFWDSNVLKIGTEKGSAGGTARGLELQTDATTRLTLTTLGSVVVNTAAVATTATDGFLYIPTCAGTPTGTPTTQTGTAPIVVDTTNNKLYFYSGGSWRDAGP